MEWQQVLEYLYGFLKDPRVGTVGGLILLDVVLGIAAAIRRGEFKWAEVARFYKTMIVPYLMGYLAFWLVAKVTTAELLGPAGWLVGEGAVTLTWAALVGALVASVVKNAKELGYSFQAD